MTDDKQIITSKKQKKPLPETKRPPRRVGRRCVFTVACVTCVLFNAFRLLVCLFQWQANATRREKATDVAQQPVEQQNETKPALVIHVGPMKTGSTTLQMMLPSLKRAFEQDNIHQFGDRYRGYEPCFLNGGGDCTDEELAEFLSRVERVREEGKHLLFTFEGFSGINATNRVRHIFDELTNKWDVRIVVIYRPFFEWIPSLYAQGYKRKIYKSKKGKYIKLRWTGGGIPLNASLMPSFPDWAEQTRLRSLRSVHNLESTQPRDPMSTKLTYEELLDGRGKVIVVDMYPQQGGLVENFFRKAFTASESKYTVKKILKKKKEGRQNRSSQFQIHFAADRISVEAFNRELIPGNKDRLKVREKIIERLQRDDGNDPPLICLNEEQKSLVWNYTERVHLRLAEDKDLTGARAKFDEASTAGTMCSVDGAKALDDGNWTEIVKEVVASM